MKRSNLIFIYISGFLLLIIDFIVKSIANRLLPFQQIVNTPIPFVDFYLTYNRGYHYIFGEISNHKLVAAIGLVVVSLLIYSLSKSITKGSLSKVDRRVYSTILILLIGSIGNVLEILVLGRATDFFIFHPFPWPSNICDQYINTIIYIMMPTVIVRSIFVKKRAKK